jgi:hypothetical protein
LKVRLLLRPGRTLTKSEVQPQRYTRFLLVTFSAVLQGMTHGAVDRVYCLGEQPITRRKAFPKALSDS